MSGDVFGNGLLVSRKTRLLAAFDHRHIFIDPDPDPEASFAERERLFRLPRSSWADYEARLLSKGGAILPRNAKTLPLSEQARALLGIEAERAEPAEIMRAILRLPVDLLYFGGIGTYVKASTESQAEAGDRANDALRVNGAELRARVVGEGANLGITQAGRIEAAQRGADGQGVRLNTDALDNSAGVSTSDHEVNIKILVTEAEREGILTRRQRDDLLREMTDEVADLVLADNHAQSLAVSLEAMTAAEDLPHHAALMARLELEGLLDRSVAGLPDADGIRLRAAAGEGLTRPELAALLPFAKLWLTEAIGESALPDDPALRPSLMAYFPRPLQERYGALIDRHRLRRELVATILGNAVANRLGPAAIGRLAAEAGPAQVTRAAWLAAEAFGIEAAARAADAAPAVPSTRLSTQLALRRLQEAAARALLPDSPVPLDDALAALRPGVAALVAAGSDRPAPEAARLAAEGIPAEVATLAAGGARLAAAPAIVRLATASGVAPDRAAAAWSAVEAGFALDALRGAVESARVPGPLGGRARAEALMELSALHARLARAQLSGTDPGGAPGAPEAARLVREAAAAGDMVSAHVAMRALGGLA